MPRPEQRRLTDGAPSRRSRSDVTSTPEVTQVVANPTNQYYRPGRNDTMSQVTDALSRFNPKLSEFANRQYSEHVEDETRKLRELGRQGFVKGLKPFNMPEEWQAGYRNMEGYAVAQSDTTKFAEAYETEFDKDGGDFDKWSNEWWQKNTENRGSDPEYLAGYVKNINASYNAVRGEHLKYKAGQTIERQNAHTMNFLVGEFGPYVEQGKAIMSADIDRVRTELRAQQPYVSNSDFNALLFTAMKSYGDQGHFQVYDALMEKRPDGTPGMYSIPEWRGKIDAARTAAVSRYNTNYDRAVAQAETDRVAAVDRSMVEVVKIGLSGDVPGALDAMRSIITSDSNPATAAEMIQWQNAVESLNVTEKETPVQSLKATELLVGISRGEVTSHTDVYSAAHRGELTWSKAVALGNEIDQRNRADNDKTKADRDARRELFSDPAITHGEKNIKGWINTRAQEFGSDASALQQLQATVLHDYWKQVESGNITPANALNKAKQMAEDYDIVRAKVSGDPLFKSGVDPFNPPSANTLNAQGNAAGAALPGESPETTRARSYEFALQSLVDRKDSMTAYEFSQEWERLKREYPEYNTPTE